MCVFTYVYLGGMSSSHSDFFLTNLCFENAHRHGFGVRESTPGIYTWLIQRETQCRYGGNPAFACHPPWPRSAAQAGQRLKRQQQPGPAAHLALMHQMTQRSEADFSSSALPETDPVSLGLTSCSVPLENNIKRNTH